MSNQRWASPLVLSSMPAIPLDSTIRRVWVHPPSCAAINRWILYGCPVLDFRGSVSPSTVPCPAARSRGTACQKACSPVHIRCHCSLSICHTPASKWSLLPPTASIQCLRLLTSNVALAQFVPRCSLSSLASSASSSASLQKSLQACRRACKFAEELAEDAKAVHAHAPSGHAHAHCSRPANTWKCRGY
jgi:hypothetical protein